MDTEKILISMSRYIHAFYDVELNVVDPNLQVKLKRFMDKKDDAILEEYWSEYMSSLSPSFAANNAQKASHVESANNKAATYYRGVKVKPVDNERAASVSKNSAIMYRGKKA